MDASWFTSVDDTAVEVDIEAPVDRREDEVMIVFFRPTSGLKVAIGLGRS